MTHTLFCVVIRAAILRDPFYKRYFAHLGSQRFTTEAEAREVARGYNDLPDDWYSIRKV